jgi:hypothetical protein
MIRFLLTLRLRTVLDVWFLIGSFAIRPMPIEGYVREQIVDDT